MNRNRKTPPGWPSTTQIMETNTPIELGWQTYLRLAISQVPEEHRPQLRKAFFAGVQYLYLIELFGAEAEDSGGLKPTKASIEHMNHIEAELIQHSKGNVSSH